MLSIQPANGEAFQDTCDVLFTGLGSLSRWSWPDIEGLHNFRGKVIHSANWDTGEGDPKKGWEDTVRSWGDKNVAVIGVGSSAIQIVPSLQPHVRHLYNYAKGRTWLSATFSQDQLQRLAGDPNADNRALLDPYTGNAYRLMPIFIDFFTEEEKQSFRDPGRYKQFRKDIEASMNVCTRDKTLSEKSHLICLQGAQLATLRGHPMQEGARTLFKQTMLQKLGKKPWIADHREYIMSASLELLCGDWQEQFYPTSRWDVVA
jgi:hypothetical protein